MLQIWSSLNKHLKSIIQHLLMPTISCCSIAPKWNKKNWSRKLSPLIDDSHHQVPFKNTYTFMYEGTLCSWFLRREGRGPLYEQILFPIQLILIIIFNWHLGPFKLLSTSTLYGESCFMKPYIQCVAFLYNLFVSLHCNAEFWSPPQVWVIGKSLKQLKWNLTDYVTWNLRFKSDIHIRVYNC